ALPFRFDGSLRLTHNTTSSSLVNPPLSTFLSFLTPLAPLPFSARIALSIGWFSSPHPQHHLIFFGKSSIVHYTNFSDCFFPTALHSSHSPFDWMILFASPPTPPQLLW